MCSHETIRWSLTNAICEWLTMDGKTMWMLKNLANTKKTDKKNSHRKVSCLILHFYGLQCLFVFSSVGPSTSKRYMHSFSVVLFYQSKMMQEYFGWNKCSNSVSRSRISFKYKKKCFVFVEISIEMIKSTWFAHSSGQKCILFHKFYC